MEMEEKRSKKNALLLIVSQYTLHQQPYFWRRVCDRYIYEEKICG